MKRTVSLVLLLALAACSSRQEPPSPEPEVLPAPRLPAAGPDCMTGVLWDEISFWKRRTRIDKHDFIAWRNISMRTLTLARIMGGDALYVEAAAAANESLRLQPKRNPEAVACLAMARMGAHEFREARELLDGAIAEQPDEAILFGVRGDAWFALGEYEKARDDYRVMHKGKPGFSSLTRMAALNFVLGDSGGSLALYRQAIDESTGIGTEPQAWAHMALGAQLMKLGRTDEACRAFADSLRVAPDYRPAMVYLATALELEGRHAAARPYLETAIEMRREPDLLRRLAAVEDVEGNAEAAGKLRTQAERLQTDTILLLEEEGKVVRLRERAELLMDCNQQLDVALECARRDLEIRRDLDACRVMARALRLNGHAKDAVPYVKKMLRYKTPDRALWEEADAVYQQAGLPADWLRDNRPFA
jgi:tetratricopeptide (TPR) repeat protein